MIRLHTLTIRRIMTAMQIIDPDDRKVLAQWAILVIAGIVVLILGAGALGFALHVFEAAWRL